MAEPRNKKGGLSPDTVSAASDAALLAAAAAMVPHFNGNLVAAHNAASDLVAIIEAKKSLIACARHKIRSEHVLMTLNQGASLLVGDTNVSRARKIFIARIREIQGAGELTIRNTLILFGAHVHIFRGLPEWQSEGFTDVDLTGLEEFFGGAKNFA